MKAEHIPSVSKEALHNPADQCLKHVSKNMIFSRPATNSGPLFDQLSHALGFNEKLDEVTLARLRREAAAILNTREVAAGHILCSGIAALEWDVEAAKAEVELAIAALATPWTYVNSIVTFNLLMRPDLALPYAEVLAEKGPSDAYAVGYASSVYVALGKVAEAAELQNRCMELNGDAEFSLNASNLLYALHRAHVSEEQFADELLLARKVLIEHQTRARSMVYNDDDDPDGAPFISMALEFVGNLEQEFEFEDDLAQRLALSERWNPSRFAVQLHYLPVEENAIVAS